MAAKKKAKGGAKKKNKLFFPRIKSGGLFFIKHKI